jgi:DNA-binding transcriptional regulator YbjK
MITEKKAKEIRQKYSEAIELSAMYNLNSDQYNNLTSKISDERKIVAIYLTDLLKKQKEFEKKTILYKKYIREITELKNYLKNVK